MYSKNKSENEKEHHDVQMAADNGFYYFVNGIKITNFPSFSPTMHFNIGDNINMMKISKRFQQEFELFSNPPYEYKDVLDDDGFKLLSKSPLSSVSRTHKHKFQQHNHHHTANHNQNLQQQQEQHQYHLQQHHHREHLHHYHHNHQHHQHNSNKNANGDLHNRKHNIPPPPLSVHQSSIHYHNNNYYKKYGDRCFIGDPQSLPTPGCPQLQS